jgi:fibronectin type III domain protein
MRTVSFGAGGAILRPVFYAAIAPARSRARAVAVLTLATMLCAAGEMQAAPRHGLCRRACTDEIAACIDAGGRRLHCRRQMLRRCRREGVSVCQKRAMPSPIGSAAGALIPPVLLTARPSSSTSVDLTWQDANAHEAGYSVERSLAPASGFTSVAELGRDATTFRDTGLAAATTYYYAVRAIGRKGNLSAASNVLATTTPPAPDVMAPSVPTGLAVSTIGCSWVNLVWAPSADSGGSGLKAYNLYRNNVFIRQVLAPTTSASVTGLAASTVYSYTLSAIDNAGNQSLQCVPLVVATPSCPTVTTTTTILRTSTTTTTTTRTSTTITSTSTTTIRTSTTTTTAPVISGGIGVRYVYGDDSSPTGYDLEVANGFTTVEVSPYRDYLDGLPANAKALLWLGDYDNTTCTWEQSDDRIRTRLTEIAGHPKIAGYFIADEPHVWECPSAPTDVKRRSDLVKSLDPGPPTLVVIQPHSPDNPFTPYVGTVDVLGVERYPCSYQNGCVFSKIDDQVALAEQAGVPRYWAVIQAFHDSWYRYPTVDELHEEFLHWRASRMSGYLVFAWSWDGDGLENHADLLQALREENAR